MKTKLSSVIILLVLSIILINVLQFFWLFYAYEITKKQYKDIVNQRFSEACAAYTHLKVSNYERQVNSYTYAYALGYKKGKETSKLSAVRTKLKINNTQLDTTLPTRFNLLMRAERMNPYQFDKNVFDSFFTAALKKDGITPSFTTDTLHLPNHLVPVGPPKEGIAKGYAFRTNPLRLNIFSHIAIIATLKNNPRFLYGRMAILFFFTLSVFIMTNIFLFYVFRKMARQKRMQEIRDDFISNITHEIKTPISIVSSVVDTLLHHGGIDQKEKALKYLSTSQKELSHLNQLVDKLMDSAVEKQLFSEPKDRVHLPELLQNMGNKYKLLYKDVLSLQYIQLANERDVLLNKIHFANAINNILENSVKYANGQIVLTLTSKVTHEECQVLLQDNGIGIPQKYLPLIFEKFFRVPSPSYKQGYGLGLYYVKQVIQNHGGTIQVQSEEGKGTLFTLIIPMHDDQSITG